MEIAFAGLPGNVARVVAPILYQQKYDLRVGLTSDRHVGETFELAEGHEIPLVPNTSEALDKYNPSMIIDFTRPNVINSNVERYCEAGIPFVTGTTGGDRTALEQVVLESGNVAVIAPNMNPQIVAFQAAMQCMAETFPDSFSGFSLYIIESHQATKADTSGTAKAMVKYFNQLGIPFTQDQIVMVRDPTEQIAMGIPQEYLGGHGGHTYRLVSKDGTVMFEFTHNVYGRTAYADGTRRAIDFLDRKIEAGEGGVYSMIDVLKI